MFDFLLLLLFVSLRSELLSHSWKSFWPCGQLTQCYCLSVESLKRCEVWKYRKKIDANQDLYHLTEVHLAYILDRIKLFKHTSLNMLSGNSWDKRLVSEIMGE